MDQDDWIESALRKHQRLTQSVVAIVKALLAARGISYLAVDGRTKSLEGIKDKIKRKAYKAPEEQLTDITGVRVILYFESDVQLVSGLLESCFCIDRGHSLDKGSLLSIDKIGYRSVHYVCDIGGNRSELPEFEGMAGLKFEIQVRTVLQHAWAEIAHDRNYKFSGKLPDEMARELHLYAGLLEMADKGFDKLSKEIDAYGESVKEAGEAESDSIPVDSISLSNYVIAWAERNNCPLISPREKDNYGEIVRELADFGIKTLGQLDEIIPPDFAEKVKEYNEKLGIPGCVRSWMLIHDWKTFSDKVDFLWAINGDADVIESYLPVDELEDFRMAFGAKR
jgi:putative GTP pyrophosphokinase